MEPYYQNELVTIYHGDCLKILPDLDPVDLVLTDPPYGMNLDTDFSKMESKLFKGKTGGNYHQPVYGDTEDYDPRLIMQYFKNTEEQFWFGADYYSDLIRERKKGSWFVWDKRLSESADKMWGSCFEMIWSKKAHKRDIIRIKWAGVFGTEQQDIRNRLHPNQKPLELYYWLLNKYSNKSDLVWDGYLGSGTTAVACIKLNRRCIGIEIEEKYCEIAAKRCIQAETGLTPGEQDAGQMLLFD